MSDSRAGLLAELKDSWKRHGGRARELGFWAVANHRVGQHTARSANPVVRLIGSRLYGVASLAIDLATGMQLHREVEIGEGLHVVHGWNIKIHPGTRIGARVGIMHDVTIGTTPDAPDSAAIIGDDVFIGCGARILGNVRIGNGARIGANSVVISDVPAGATAIGVPARVLRYTGREGVAAYADAGPPPTVTA